MPPVLRAARTAAGREPGQAAAQCFRLPGQETFVGYYDVLPASQDGGALLAHATKAARRAKRPGDLAVVGYFERESGAFTEIAQTTLWCWQLGARLRWWPGEARALAYNAILEGVAGYWMAESGKQPQRLTDRPLFDVSRDGRLGIALNFGRLAKARPGYGYPDLQDPFENVALPESDGVTLVDLQSGRAELLAPLGEIAGLQEDPQPDAFHYLNAASLSPAGTAFSVLHKRIPSLDRLNEWSVDAIVGRTDGSELRRVALPGAASHYWWLDENRVLFTANNGGAGSSRYVIYDMRRDLLESFPRAVPSVDGHPSRHDASDLWVTDRYPDLYGEQALYLLDLSGARRELGRFRTDPAYRDEWKCDLHPRWLPEGASVAVDSTHQGFRAVYEVGFGNGR